MSTTEMTQEERIMRMMKRVLTDVAKETHAKPGFRHPLSESTIQGIRECLALISARERELVEERGHSMDMRPHFVDEPKKTVVVPFDAAALKKGTPSESK